MMHITTGLKDFEGLRVFFLINIFLLGIGIFNEINKHNFE